MDQEKIGKFIAVLRKEKGLTQARLAESLGVSDKTVSKWECGKGMPELAVLLPLCGALGISVNELLSGMRLNSHGDYSKKAEENMMELIRHVEENKKEERRAGVRLAAALCAGILLFVWALTLSDMRVTYFLDFPSLLILLVTAALFLFATGLGKDFGHAFAIALGRGARYDRTRALAALDLASKTLLLTGFLESILQLCILFFLQDAAISPFLLKSAAVACMTLLYGLMGCLLLLPLRSRLALLRDA